MNRSQIAQVFGVSVVTIDAWVRKDCPFEKKGRNGAQYEFSLPAVITWRVEQLVSQAMGMFRSGDDIKTAEKRLAFAQAEIKELELAEKQGVLINTEAAAKLVERGIMETRSQLLALPTKLAPRLPACKTAPQFKAVLDKAVRDALHGLSRIKFSEDVLEPGVAEPVAPPARADGERVGGQKPTAQPRKQRGDRPVGHRKGRVPARHHGRRQRSPGGDDRGDGERPGGQDGDHQ